MEFGQGVLGVGGRWSSGRGCWGWGGDGVRGREKGVGRWGTAVGRSREWSRRGGSRMAGEREVEEVRDGRGEGGGGSRGWSVRGGKQYSQGEEGGGCRGWSGRG